MTGVAPQGFYKIRACVLSRFSHVQQCETLWTVARQALSTGILQASILE